MMTNQPRDLVFLSYSRKDAEIYNEVRQCLIDQGLGDRLWDDTEVRLGERWDQKIQDGMERTAVAVLILSDGYFGRRKGGGEYILERELPYFLECRQAGELDLLPVYWRPSPHFKPDRREPVKLFAYDWQGDKRTFDLHAIQALVRHDCLEDAAPATRRDALQRLAAEAECRLADRLAARPTGPSLVQGRRPLTVELAADPHGLRRLFKVGGEVIPASPPGITRVELDGLRAVADLRLPDDGKVGQTLYHLLFRGRDGHDLFPRHLAAALGDRPGASARNLAVAVEVRCAPSPAEPWLLRLPWHLTADGGERLAECCGWSFEATPPGLQCRCAPVLSPDPPVLLLVDDRVPGAAAHGNALTQFMDRHHAFAADQARCADLRQVAAAVGGVPQPEILYAYAHADLDLAALADALGESVSLLVLNLIGDRVPTLPPTLVRERKVVCAVYAADESVAAREAGARWLQGLLTDRDGIGYQRIAVGAFGPRVRLWSGCAGLESRIAATRGIFFRRSLIKLLLDRIAARREVSDEVAAALADGRGVLGLVAAGTADDHPHLLPKQVWYHYRHHREAGSRDTIRRLELATGPIAAADELLVRFAQAIGHGRDDWEDGIDRAAADLALGEHLIFSLEWRLDPCPADQDPTRWRDDWLAAWLELGTQSLATYARTRVLLVQTLIVEAADPAAAAAWTEGVGAVWEAGYPSLSETGKRLSLLRLAPLSEVPQRDLERFLEREYGLNKYHPKLNHFAVAKWVRKETAGVFTKAVDLVEKLHDTNFEAAYDAPWPAP